MCTCVCVIVRAQRLFFSVLFSFLFCSFFFSVLFFSFVVFRTPPTEAGNKIQRGGIQNTQGKTAAQYQRLIKPDIFGMSTCGLLIASCGFLSQAATAGKAPLSRFLPEVHVHLLTPAQGQTDGQFYPPSHFFLLTRLKCISTKPLSV